MEPELTDLGTYLRQLRTLRGWSLAKVAASVNAKGDKKKGVSRQSLSLIENGLMKLPAGRLQALADAYCTGQKQKDTLAKLFEMERLGYSTTEVTKFIAAMSSVMDMREPGTVYVIGGKRLPFKSRDIQDQAAGFLLQDRENEIVFFYPSRYEQVKDAFGPWPRNTHQDLWEVYNAIASRIASNGRARQLEERVKFFRINEESYRTDMVIAAAVSLCHPLIAATIKRPRAAREPSGFVFIKGDEDERASAFVLLSSEYARRYLHVIDKLLCRRAKGGIEREYPTRRTGG